jgi:uncharacterized protein YcbK (DUF882 family)
VRALVFALLVSQIALADPPKAPKKAPPRPTLAAYSGYVKKWHAPVPGKPPSVDASGRPMLVLASLNTGDRIEIAASAARGGFASSALDRAAFVLREPASGNEHPVEPRLLDVLYAIQTHFSAQEIRVVSAYRTPHRGTGSNHGRGRAADFIVPGTSDEEVARFAREIGFCGVGVYPASGFVHVDVRDRSYFWIDSSAPGRRNRERGIFGDLAKKSDEQALARGEHATSPLWIASDVDAALRARAQGGGEPAMEEDEDDSD